MRTGFYNIGKLGIEELKSFFIDAVMLSYNSHVEKLDCAVSFGRQHTDEKSIKEMIDSCNPAFHNVCIDRSIQHNEEQYGEIGYNNLSDKYFLYIFISLPNLKILIDKYNLEEK